MDHQHLQINGSSDWLALHPVHMPGFRDLYELSLPSAARQRLCNLGEHEEQSTENVPPVHRKSNGMFWEYVLKKEESRNRKLRY